MNSAILSCVAVPSDCNMSHPISDMTESHHVLILSVLSVS